MLTLIYIKENRLMKRFILSYKKPHIVDLVAMKILPKAISEYTDSDIGSPVNIPYNDTSEKILLNDGKI